MIHRDVCIVCTNPKLSPFFTEQDMPLAYIPRPLSSSVEDDTLFTLKWVKCDVCGCVQLEDLADPADLYSVSHNETISSGLWLEHHTKFAEFVSSYVAPKDIVVEIGGGNGYLKGLCKDKCAKYLICDYLSADQPDHFFADIENMKKDTYPSHDVVIMSHTYEHLYNPRAALLNCFHNGTKKILLSVPWMEAWLKDQSSSIIHAEHTFFLVMTHLIYVAESCGYLVEKAETFKRHSQFLCLVRRTLPEAPEAEAPAAPPVYNTTRLSAHFEQRNRFMYTLDVDPSRKTVLIPGGHFASIFYSYAPPEFRANILGCCDNDKNKQNKRLYGTTLPMISFQDAKEKWFTSRTSGCEKPQIIFLDCPYKNELQQQAQHDLKM